MEQVMKEKKNRQIGLKCIKMMENGLKIWISTKRNEI